VHPLVERPRRAGARAVVAAALSLALSPLAAGAATPLGALRYAPDVTVALGGVAVDHNEVAQDNLGGVVALVDIGAIPSAAIVTAYDRLVVGHQLLAFDTHVALAGGVTARPGDVVRYNGSTFELLFDADARGIPRGVMVDALSATGPSDLLLSFDVPIALGSVAAAAADVVRLQNGVFSLFFDASAAGVASGLDLDAVHLLPASGRLLVSFDGSGMVGGVVFDDEDVLEYSPNTGSWELAYEGRAEHPGWLAADLQALWATTAVPPVPAPPQVSGPGGGGGAGGAIPPGSSRLHGRGISRGIACDTCIEIYDAGANGVADAPPGSVDDILLGTGGTDAAGNFVDCAGNLGISVHPPLVSGQRVFAADVCAELIGGVAVVAALAPAMSAAGVVAAVGMFLAIGALRLRRRR